MRVRWAGLVLALILAGAAAGYGLGSLDHHEPAAIDHPEPVPARSPSIPVDPTPTFAPDVDYPALATDLRYRTRRIGDPPFFQWEYDAPRGWVRTTTDQPDEFRWRPADEPPVGGYSLRVKIVTQRLTPEQMVEQKIAAVESIYDDVEIVDQDEDEVYFTYRDGLDHQRHNLFWWFPAPGQTAASFEMSVAGRGVDLPGLEALETRVAASVRKVP
ncbi:MULTISPECIES: hypothetical protein [unclassified Nocardioides]|uniref:hypothetical protein n=1 Tax=unclassified Nocardioides TaxID=2615069 RepID=UPI0000571861|nr:MULTISPECIES: hypothetical protein [unclassified Nocardioides]ABL83991.1 hypothetical protein Noca_4494 [Nocardioides sp. JS614]